MRKSVSDGVLTLTLDRPEQYNALTREEMVAFSRSVRAAQDDASVRLIVLDHDGTAFCAGLDLGLAETLAGSPSEAEATIDAANDVVRAILASPKPVVALLRGPVVGVAVSIALAADLTVCGEDAYFNLVFTKIGLMPDGGATEIVAASIGRAKAMRMALLAAPLSAAEAAQAGLVTHFVPGPNFDEEASRVVAQVVRGPVEAIARTKSAINAATLAGLDSAFSRERAGQLRLLTSADFLEGTEAFRERRHPEFD
ncbi:enoyl-CoA hydratase-related protein [Streptomyces sp. NPDC090499]|uniref:enoyl-CoA hydratase-related protein n=1 Tax=unclassified Streptomyces TaxID=2593676 RepID=UPI00382E01F8